MNDLEIRRQSLSQWLAGILPKNFVLMPMQSGAGHRRYWRVRLDTGTYVVMDSPVDEKFNSFIQLSHAFSAANISVPAIITADQDRGFLLITDFGDNLYEKILSPANADQLYLRAFESLLKIQRLSRLQTYPLPAFDMVHYREKMQWFIEFYLQRFLKLSVNKIRQDRCLTLFDLMIQTAQQQPLVCVHYDYHCRNLCLLPNGQCGVLDFQDAVHGPITYDIMALLRDCYLEWPGFKVQQWQEHFRQMAQNSGLLPATDPELWNRWCDFSSAQRHIKNIGLFARFYIMGKHSSYLEYIPRLLNYLREISSRHSEMKDFQNLLEELLP